jgi:putative tricarboxylic transport membrane protein
MDTFSAVVNGFVVCLQPINLWYTFIGVLLGTVVGVLPGLGAATGMALLLPITYGMNPTSALIMLSGLYYGAKYGGSTTAILIRTPGEASAVMTSLDGYEMAKKGRAGAALAVSAIGSFIAGTIGVIALSLFAVPLADAAIKFGPGEYFCLMLFALTAVSSLAGKSPAKGLLSTTLGLMIATVGTDLQTGQQRFTLGIPEFQDGISFIVVVVGLFAMAEAFRGMEELHRGINAPIMRITGKLWLTRDEWRRSIGPIWRGGIIGFIIGVLPGAGGTISAIMSYALERRLAKDPEQFGKGAIEGVAGPESANNSDTAGAMVPMLSLGIPGGGGTAVLLGAFIMYGIQPGPMLFSKHPDLVWGLIDSMYVGNIMLLILNLPLIGIFVKLLYVPSGLLYPLIVTTSAIGAYGISGDTLDLYLVLFFGVIGYVFEKLEIPAAPLVLSLVLGSQMEQSFRQAMTISGASPSIFFNSVISVTLLSLAVISIAGPFLAARLRKRPA